MNRDGGIKEMFFSWLSSRVLSDHLSDFEKTGDIISEYCERNDLLEKPLFETTDLNVLSSIIQAIGQDRDFRKRVALDFERCSALIKFYIIFLKNNKLTFNEEQSDKSFISKDVNFIDEKMKTELVNQRPAQGLQKKAFSIKSPIQSEYFDYIYYAICRQDLMIKRSVLQEKYREKDEAQMALEQSVSDRNNAQENMQALDCRIMEIVGEVDERKKDIDELTKEIISLQQELGETFVFSFGRRKNIKKKIKVIENQLVEEERKIVELVSEQENLENESNDELVETLEHRVDHQKDRVVALEDAIKHFERDIDDINLKLCDLEEKIRCHIRVKKKAEEARRAEEERKAEEARRAEEERKAEEARCAEEERKAEEARRAEEERKAGKACLIEEERRVKESARLEAVIRRTLVNNDKREKEKLKNDRFMETIRKAEEARRAEEERKAGKTCLIEEERKAKESAHLEAVIRRTLINNDKREKEKLKNDRFMETIRKAEEVRQEKIRETEEVGRAEEVGYAKEERTAEEAGYAKEERTAEETCFVEEAEKEGEVLCTENERTDETSCFIEENNRLFYDFEPFDEDETDPPYYKLYGLNPENYYGIRIESLDFSVRLENRLKKYGTLGNLLMQNDRSLCEIKGFGKVCVEELHKYFANLNKNISLTSLQDNSNQDNPKRQDAVLSLTDELIPFKEQIKHGDFSFLAHTEINDQSLKMIDQFKHAYELIDPELIKKSIEGDSEIISVLQMLYKFINDVETLKKAEFAIKNIPAHRLEEHVLWIMKCYSSNEETIKYLRTFCTEDHQTLGEFLFANREQIVHNNPVFVHLIKWCQYNLTEDMNSFFVDRVKNERDLEIVHLRAAHKTLEEIGNKLNITRERVRQLENKTKERFNRWQQRQRMMFKIFLEMGEKNGLSSMEVEDFLGTYGKEFVYLMKECEIDDLKYKEEFDLFIIEDLSLNERIQDYVDALPDEFPAKKLEEFLQIAEKENNYPVKLVLAVIEEHYGKTGDLYHRFNLTLASMYGNIMKRYYPAGMHIYDPATINDFRDHVMADYGRDISDKNDRSISAILARIGILCGRGIYKYRTEKSYISEGLATQIHDYIENSQAPIFMTNTLFSIFEEELLAEGIDNKYYLQGVLKDRYEKEWIFRRDYISKDESYTTIHSSIVELIKRSKYPVSKDDLNRKFPGVTEIVINLAVNDPDIINLFGEYIHTDRLKLSDAEIAYLKDTVEVFIKKKDVCHCKDLYEYIVVDDPTLLTNNFVQSSFSLYSVLDHLFGDLYNFSRPYIARKNATIERGMDILEDIVQESERMDLAEIQAFAREHRVMINSIRDFIDACNETHLIINDLEIASIEYIGITEEMARDLESHIVAEIDATMPIHQLHCIHSLPTINVEWTAWLIYSVLKKWSTKLEVGASSNQFKNSYPIVAPIGKLDASMLAKVEVPYDGTIAQVDDLSKIDELISDYVLDEWEDLYEL